MSSLITAAKELKPKKENFDSKSETDSVKDEKSAPISDKAALSAAEEFMKAIEPEKKEESSLG